MQIFTFTLVLTLLDLYHMFRGSQHIEAIGNDNDLQEKKVAAVELSLRISYCTSLTRRKKRQKQTMAKAMSKELDSILNSVAVLLFMFLVTESSTSACVKYSKKT